MNGWRAWVRVWGEGEGWGGVGVRVQGGVRVGGEGWVRVRDRMDRWCATACAQYVYVYAGVCMCMCVYICICIHVYMCMRMRMCTCICVYMARLSMCAQDGELRRNVAH